MEPRVPEPPGSPRLLRPRSVGELRPECEYSARNPAWPSSPARSSPAGNSNGAQPSERATGTR